MNTEALLSEIQQLLPQAPAIVLQDILYYLQATQSIAPEDLQQARNLQRILLEDKELLQKLAL